MSGRDLPPLRTDRATQTDSDGHAASGHPTPEDYSGPADAAGAPRPAVPVNAGRSAQTLAPARAPVGPGKISAAGIVLAAATIAVGLIAVHDALIAAGAVEDQPWINAPIHRLDGLNAQWWAVPIGLLMAVLGLWMVTIAVTPRSSRAISLKAGAGVYLSRRDLRSIAAHAAEDVDGVLSTRTAATGRTITVAAVVTAADTDLTRDIQTSVEQAVAVLEQPPRVKVTTNARRQP